MTKLLRNTAGTTVWCLFCRNDGEPFTYLCQLLHNLNSDIDQLCVILKRKTSHWCCLNKLTIYVCPFSQKRTPWTFGATGRRWKPRWAPLVNTLRHTFLKINVMYDVTADFNKGVGNCAVRFYKENQGGNISIHGRGNLEICEGPINAEQYLHV